MTWYRTLEAVLVDPNAVICEPVHSLQLSDRGTGGTRDTRERVPRRHLVRHTTWCLLLVRLPAQADVAKRHSARAKQTL